MIADPSDGGETFAQPIVVGPCGVCGGTIRQHGTFEGGAPLDLCTVGGGACIDAMAATARAVELARLDALDARLAAEAVLWGDDDEDHLIADAAAIDEEWAERESRERANRALRQLMDGAR